MEKYKLVKCYPGSEALGYIKKFEEFVTWGITSYPEFYKKTKYPDGDLYITILKKVNNFTFKINNTEDLWTLHHVVEALNHAGVRPIVSIPSLFSAQADRRFSDNESSGLKLVCEFLNKMNANFRIFHPHNPEVVEALIDGVEIIDNSEFIINVLSSIEEDIKCDFANNGILASSDAGGFKPLMKLCDKLQWKGDIFSASKGRAFIDGKTQLTQLIDKDDFGGKDILIIDDISVYGGTFKGLSKLLRGKNCGKLYLAVSHMTIQDLGNDPVTNYFDKVFTTNSKFDYYASLKGGNIGNQPVNLEVIKMF